MTVFKPMVVPLVQENGEICTGQVILQPISLKSDRLLDTNAVIYLVNGRLVFPLPDGQYRVSIITEIELLSFPDLSASEEEKIRDLLRLFNRVHLTDAVRDETIRLRRKNRLKLPDAIVAASALIYDAILLTNDQAFSSINGLAVESLQLSRD